MECELLHIVPFDMGVSFSMYEDTKRYSKQQFIDDLSRLIMRNHYQIDCSNKSYMCVIYVSPQIECRLFDYGIGVFVFKNLHTEYPSEFEEKFGDNIACKTYYRKKIEQKAILYKTTADIEKIYEIVEMIWSLKKNGIRSYSSDKSYKYGGLSYVLTVYHIVDENIDAEENRQIDLLMNPGIMGEILDNKKWAEIDARVNVYKPIGYEKEDYNEVSSVIASWSAVAVVEKRATKAIDSIVNYEVSLQSAWFLFDALIDNLENTRMTDLELQRSKSTATNVFLDVGNILSANMGTNDKKAREVIYTTSGLENAKDKCFLLLENRIAIEKAKHNSRQTVYGIVTEILLVAFTLIQIYEPIKNFVTGTFTSEDIVVGIFILLILIISSVLIIRREK